MKPSRFFLILTGVLTLSCGRNPVPEITWSVMHPTPVDSVYMKRLISESAGRKMDNFEVCGGSNSECEGSLDGLLYYEEYPLAAAAQNVEVVRENRAQMQSIVRLAHEAGKEVYYWHREVLCNRGLLATFPDLLDAEGEFDLLGARYEQLLRYKIRKTFEALPGLDGIVLTLTEASFSALHNSRPDLYPPEKVVERIGGIFAEELEARGKRFILRSFGSIEEDYRAIMNGAVALARTHRFEVETKITPYDFDPFLPDNPFLVKTPGCTLGAECDVLGEFLGCGRMLPEQVEDIVRYVRFARKQGVDRFTIRLDRKWKSVFDVYPINLYAYEQAILHPRRSAERIRRDYYRSRYPARIADSLCTMSREGMECVKKAEFIDGNLIFHWYPTTPEIRLLKAGGILKLFAPQGSLERGRKQWAIRADRDVPGRTAILAEKEEALAIARRNLARLDALEAQLDPADRIRLREGWTHSLAEAAGTLELCRVICAYFDDMEARRADAPALAEAVSALPERLEGLDLLRPFSGIAQRFVEEYPLELSLRQALDGKALDYVLPGCVSDQIRTEHYMHGCYCAVVDGRPVATVGNPVFPNAYLAFSLKGTGRDGTLEIRGRGSCQVNVNGESRILRLQDGVGTLPVKAAGNYEVSLSKAPEGEYPQIASVALF